MFTFYFGVFVGAFVLSLLLTFLVKKIILKLKIVDDPAVAPEIKIQKKPIPYSGGLAIFVALAAIMLFFVYFFPDRLIGLNIEIKHVWGIVIAGLVLMIGGIIDDKYRLSAKKSIIAPIVAALVVIACGIGIKVITNPFGGVFHLDTIEWEVLQFRGVPYHITLWSDLFTFVWLIGMMYTTKLLDGLDGLVTGVSVIGALMIFFLTTTTIFFQPDTALISIIFAGACFGFLVLNFNPAKIYLGEGGSLLTGFMLGTLAIISGGKIATALLIMGVPILDVVWIIIRRAIVEKRSPFKVGDNKHLHFRLLSIGFSHKQAVLFYYLIAIAFGVLTLFLQSKEKLIALGILLIFMLVMAICLVSKRKTKEA